MTAYLIRTSRTSSAYAHLVDQVRTHKRLDALAPVTILVPSAGVVSDLRRQLGDTLSVSMFQFYGLGQAVLDEAGTPIHQIDDIAVRRLVRRILEDLGSAGALTAFERVLDKPGFVDVVLDWIREMKSQGIFPEEYETYAREVGGDQDRQLAAIYIRYQAFMQAHETSDADGLLWVAAEALETNPNLYRQEGPMYALGFDQFTPVQHRILRQLASRTPELHIYLLWDKHRSQDSLALTRLRRTQEALLDSIPLVVDDLEDDSGGEGLLRSIHGNIFEIGEAHPPDPASLHLVEAPSREDEVRWALRQVKRLLLQGVSPADIAVLAPKVDTYLPLVRTVGTEYNLPITFERPLVSIPPVAALVNLLRLPGSYSWSLTFDALRSPYIRQEWLSDEHISLLDRLSRERPVVEGRDQWSYALQPLTVGTPEGEDEDFGPPLLAAVEPPETLAIIEGGLMAFFDHLTPPETATYREYTWWLQTALVGCDAGSEEGAGVPPAPEPSLDLHRCCRESPFPGRDLDALTRVLVALRSLLAAVETVPGSAEVSWEAYRDEVLTLLGVIQVPSDPSHVSVRFDRLEGARARVVDHLFVLGLSESEFPVPPPPDPLYAPGEREHHPLPLVRAYPADDASLWWQLVGGVQCKLVLLRPYIDENGAPWEPSPYWDALLACVDEPEVEVVPIAAPPELVDAASASELLVALVHAGAQTCPPELACRWDYAQRAEAIIRQRDGWGSPGEFEGVLLSPDLKHELSQRYGDRHVWSASRLNRYASCPYGFFAEHVLKLAAQRDPEEGMDVMQRGSLLHAILEHLYKHLAETGTPPTGSNLGRILGWLEESCAAVYPTAPRRYGFRPGTLWVYEQEELRRLLRAFVSWECESNDPVARYTPFLQEAAFGIGPAGPPPLKVTIGDARFRLHGVIDRLDRDADGNLRVIDYKSGGTPYSKPDMHKGLAMQTALYALAAGSYWLFGQGRVAESHYWHISSRVSSGDLHFDDRVRDNEDAQIILEQAAWSVAQVRLGVFPSAPAKPSQWGGSCARHCDFAGVCRVTRRSITKARKAGLV